MDDCAYLMCIIIFTAYIHIYHPGPHCVKSADTLHTIPVSFSLLIDKHHPGIEPYISIIRVCDSGINDSGLELL